MIPMFMLAPYAEVSEQHITRVARRRRDALLGELRVLAWARPAAGDARAQARGHRGVPSLRWVTRSLDHPTPTAHDVVRAVVRGTRRQLGIALAEVVAARAPPALRATSPAISLRAGFATAAARGRSLGGRDHAPWTLEERADRPPLHPPGRPLDDNPAADLGLSALNRLRKPPPLLTLPLPGGQDVDAAGLAPTLAPLPESCYYR
jgi:hypothetical protein